MGILSLGTQNLPIPQLRCCCLLGFRSQEFQFVSPGLIPVTLPAGHWAKPGLRLA